jgi:hypothetical protein
MKNKHRRTLPKSALHDCVMVPITDPDEIAALDRRIREAEKTLAAQEADSQRPKARKTKQGAARKTTDVTYGQLDKVLRSLGFTCRDIKLNGDARVYEHKHTTAMFIFPAVPESHSVLDYHLLGVRTSLDLYGIADPAEFAARLKKAG